ncbi:Ubiquitin-like-specific protease 1D-like protein [Drosera capensis]
MKIDIKTLLTADAGADSPPAELIIVNNNHHFSDDRTTTTTRREDTRSSLGMMENLTDMWDRDLEESIARKSKLLTGGLKLPDGGAKARDYVERLRAELERRRLRRIQQAEEREKPVRSERTGLKRAADDAIEVDPPPEAPMQSQYASSFVQRIEGDIDSRRGGPFDEDLCVLSRCDKRTKSQNGQFSKRGRGKNGLSRKERESMGFISRQNSFEPCSSNSENNSRKSANRDQTVRSSRQIPFEPCSFHSENNSRKSDNGDQPVRSSPYGALHQLKRKFFSSVGKSDDCQALSLYTLKSKKEKMVILDDDDELRIEEKSKAIEEPTPREDPQSIDIHYSDLQCLTPEAYLTSPIMNFYIQFLQGPSSPADEARYAYHFFNTYFYKKLQDAVSYQKNDKVAFFIKFRRWWKGVNIFQKAYILLPIHESLHWSLAIICIPDKEDESGPIVLHLDSLGYHSSESIFDNIKRFLKEEWNFLNNDSCPVDVPIADRIWKHLPRKIEHKKITVPQQENDYDCGLFVLYFMERFIEEAPQRLRKDDLAMFGRQWFRPEEASSLRGKIKSILVSEFRKSEGEWELGCLPSGSERASSSERINIS